MAPQSPDPTALAGAATQTPAERARAHQQLLGALAVQPWRHDFFQLLRWVEALHPQAPRLGRAARPRDEPLRIGQDPELSFAPAALHSYREQTGAPPRVGQRFFGLFGPMGPLPLHLSEYVRERARSLGDATPLAFADIFQHRASLLFYRAWAQAQPVSHLDRPGDDAFGRWLASLAGLGDPSMRERDHVHDHAKRLHVGTLARGPRNAEGLVRIVGQYFKVPVRIEPHVGHWLDLERSERLVLSRGGRAATGRLGLSAAAGSRVWDRQSRFRLHLGPLGLAQYERFLPGQPALLALRDWLRLYTGLGLACELKLVLAGREVPEARLGGHRGGGAAARLGRSSWLGVRRVPADRPPPHDRADLAFLVEPVRSCTDASR